MNEQRGRRTNKWTDIKHYASSWNLAGPSSLSFLACNSEDSQPTRHNTCVAPYVDIILHRRQFSAKSAGRAEAQKKKQLDDFCYKPFRLQTCCKAHKAQSCTAESAVSPSSGKNGPNDLRHRFHSSPLRHTVNVTHSQCLSVRLAVNNQRQH